MARFDPQDRERFLRSLNPRRRSLKRGLDARRLPYAVAIDNPDKETNIGNMIRTAHSFLCGEFLLIGSPRYQGAGSHGVERFEPMRHFPDRRSFLDWLADSDYESVAVEIHPEAVRLDRFVFPDRPIFLLGNELYGLDEKLLAACTHKLMVPQFGLAPCLNVSITCSLVLYAFVTSRFPELETGPVRGRKYLVDAGSGRKPPRSRF